MLWSRVAKMRCCRFFCLISVLQGKKAVYFNSQNKFKSWYVYSDCDMGIW